MVIGTFTSWTGRSFGAPGDERQASNPRVAPSPSVEQCPEIVYAMRPALRDAMIVTVVSPEICMRKTVRPTGHTHVVLDRGDESVAISTDHLAVIVTTGGNARRVDVASSANCDVTSLRGGLAASAAVRAFRSLANAVDETESDTAERLSVRLAGALASHLDGDPGAVRRLSRELHAKYCATTAGGRRRPATDWDIYKRSVVRACAELHMGLAGLSCWDRARNVWIFKWLVQTEAAWHGYVFGSAAWRARR
jgi:hypothetical protein